MEPPTPQPAARPAHDAAYKLLFSQPRMVEDLLRGFAARDWSDALDFSTLRPAPASYVSEGLSQRHGDLVWQVDFRGGVLYVMVLLEFQSTVDAAMAVRVLTYTSLLYERLIAGGALRGRGKLPPVLPIVIYNGSRPWTAAEDVTELIAGGEETAALARYQPSLRYYLLDEGRISVHDLPGRNLVSALIALETNQRQERTPELLAELLERLRESADPALRRVFQQWVDQVPAWRVPWDAALEPRERQEVRTMLAETAQRWRAEDREQGRKEGHKEGIAQGIEVVCRMAARKFAAETAPRLSALLEGETDPERLAQVGEWIIECETGDDLLSRVHDAS